VRHGALVRGTGRGANTAPQATSQAEATGNKPNILVIWGDDIGQGNISAFTKGVMGYRTPNIDRVANEGMIFTDYSKATSTRVKIAPAGENRTPAGAVL